MTPVGTPRPGWNRNEIPKHKLFVDSCSQNGVITDINAWATARYDDVARVSRTGYRLTGFWEYNSPDYDDRPIGGTAVIVKNRLISTGWWKGGRQAWVPKVQVNVNPDGTFHLFGTDQTGDSTFWSTAYTGVVLDHIDVKTHRIVGIPRASLQL